MPVSIRFLPALLLAACAVPHPVFMGAEKQVVEVEGSRFAVYRRADRVEIYRISAEVLPRRDVVLSRARKAIVQVTGCTVVPGSLIGDQALMRAELDCTTNQP